MSVSADGYVLRVPVGRRETLIEGIAKYGTISEPVPEFDHSRGTPILVLLSFSDGEITHVADGLKGRRGGTEQHLLKMSNVDALPRPITFASLVENAPANVQAHLRDRLSQGGVLAPRSLGVTVDALLQLEPSIAQRIARYSERRASYVAGLTSHTQTSLALQKESLNAALRIAGINPDAVVNWLPPGSGTIASYIDGIQAPPVREDLMVIADAEVFPGLDLIERDVRTATKVFSKGKTRLRVTMANRQPLEEQTGADLIYFNETHNSFVMVQYKAMRAQAGQGPARIHVYRPDDQLAEEIARMEEINDVISRIPPANTMAEYRLNSDPFYLKLCPNTSLNLDDKSLFPGMYLPLGYWKLLIEDSSTLGPRGGRVVGFENVSRKLNNTEFVQLVASGFVGSRVYQSEFIRALVGKVLAQGKSITLAVHSDNEEGRPELALDCD